MPLCKRVHKVSYLYKVEQNKNPKKMSYAIQITTARPTINGTVENCSSILLNEMNLTRYVFKTYESAQAFAKGYAVATGCTYVAPATQEPVLKEGQSFVEVTAA